MKGGQPLKVVVVGLGQMGVSHALAYHHNEAFTITSLVIRSPKSLPHDLSSYPQVSTFQEALATNPDVVSINTHGDSHATLAIAAMHAGAHVFVEKPLATTVADAQRVLQTAHATNRKLVVGYILRHHRNWQAFILRARNLGPPFVMRMNLNQRSTGAAWSVHRRLLQSASPVVDCGVHCIDVFLQIAAPAKPIQVRGMGVRLSDEIADDQVNYGHLQVVFDDGSVGWYEAGWGPMVSETAHFVKDVMGPRGSVSILADEGSRSADVDSHTQSSRMRVHEVGGTEAEIVQLEPSPSHDELCALEQQFLLDAIRNDVDLAEHGQAAVDSLAVVLAADLSMRERRAVDL